MALQDHFKYVKNAEAIEKEKSEPRTQLDLGFKEGETIKINMKITVSYQISEVLSEHNLTFALEKGRKRIVIKNGEENRRTDWIFASATEKC